MYTTELSVWIIVVKLSMTKAQYIYIVVQVF